MENTQGSLQSGIPGSSSETQESFCDGLGSKIMLQIPLVPLLPFMAELLLGSMWTWTGLGNQVHPMTQTLFLNNDAVFQDDNAPFHTAGTVQS
jgi:hypothetical protein